MLGLSFTAPDARVWTHVMDATGKFTESGVFILKPDALYVKAIDPSRTAMIEFIIPQEAFEEYRVDKEASIYLSMEELSKILKSADSKDRLHIEFSEDNIKIDLTNGIITRTFKLPLRSEVTHEEIPELELQYVNEYVMNGEVLYDALASIEKVGDVLKVSGDENTLTLKCVGDLGEAEVTLSIEKGSLKDARSGNPGFEASYSIDYLTYMKKPINSSEEAVIRVDRDMPMHLELRFPSGSKLNYYVAPRTE